ncbi:uncharacterized protein LOC114592044 [Podarcis muralis]
MPKRRTVRSLEWLCLENVAKNIQRIWAKVCAENHQDGHLVRSVAEPYICLPDSLVQKLFKLMEEGNRLNRPVLRFLLVPQLTVLSLNVCPRLVIKAVADIIAVRCKNLSSLDIRGCCRIPADSLVDLVKALPSLAQLNLSDTQCNAQVLAAVGSHCRQLLELDVVDCSRLSPECLLHLAYDPATGSLRSPALKVLRARYLMGRPLLQCMVQHLVFLLLALRSLKILDHPFVLEAVCAIYRRQFNNVPVAPEFPSLEELARRRMSAHSGHGLTLTLTELDDVALSCLPAVLAVCPHLADVTLILEGNPGGFGQDFAPWRHISCLTLDNDSQCDVADLLPMAAALGPQLHSLSLSGFLCEDASSFWTFLGHCLNLRKLVANLPPPAVCAPDDNDDDDDEEMIEDLEENFSPAPHQFPHLRYIFLMYPDSEGPLPSQHKAVFRACLVSLLRHSPQLESLLLACLPFSLDSVFEQVLEPPATALTHLQKLSLMETRVSGSTIHLLLSSENQLSFIDVPACSRIFRADYDEFLRRVRSEGLDMEISWE